MRTNILNLVVTLTLGIILVGSLMAPVISEAIDDGTLTKTNTGISVSALSEWSAEFEMSGGAATAEVNDVAVTVTETAPMFVSNNACVIFNSSALILYYWDSANELGKDISSPTSLTVTVEDGTTTIVVEKSGTTTLTYTDTWAYMYDANGTYVSKYIPNQDTPIYFNDLNQLHGSFKTLNGSPVAYYAFEGKNVTINDDDVVTATVVTNDTDSADVKSCIFNRSTSTSGYLFECNSATEYPLVVVAPHTVTGVIDNGIGAASIAILATIPLIVIIGLVIAATRNIYD